jgi:predicted HTH domain antitoxin
MHVPADIMQMAKEVRAQSSSYSKRVNKKLEDKVVHAYESGAVTMEEAADILEMSVEDFKGLLG